MDLNGVHIISLIGAQGTGKSAIAKRLATKLNYQFVEASDVVRRICGDIPRGDMYKTKIRTQHEWNWLGKGITDCIKGNVVVSGVREKENHQHFLEQGADLRVIKLWAPENERFGRLIKNGKAIQYKDFVKHGEAELSIGLRDMLNDETIPEVVSAGRAIEDTIEEILWTLHL